MAVIMDGKALAAEIKAKAAADALVLREKGCAPGLAVILVGEDPASKIYVKHKKLDCDESGIESYTYTLPETATQSEVLELIKTLNADSRIHGILVQQPFPRHLDTAALTEAVDPRKDVDAFHPENVGLVTIGSPRFAPCTPAGVMALLDKYGIEIAGKRCVVVGRSNIVGKPQALLLLQHHGTVTICHSRTPNLAEITREADILVAAAGKRGLITGDMIKPGAAVIDVAMNKKENGKLCGDVVFEEAERVAGWITPVPGGVGPMTRAVLMSNTILSANYFSQNLNNPRC